MEIACTSLNSEELKNCHALYFVFHRLRGRGRNISNGKRVHLSEEELYSYFCGPKSLFSTNLIELSGIYKHKSMTRSYLNKSREIHANNDIGYK